MAFSINSLPKDDKVHQLCMKKRKVSRHFFPGPDTGQLLRVSAETPSFGAGACSG